MTSLHQRVSKCILAMDFDISRSSTDQGGQEDRQPSIGRELFFAKHHISEWRPSNHLFGGKLPLIFFCIGSSYVHMVEEEKSPNLARIGGVYDAMPRKH